MKGVMLSAGANFISPRRDWKDRRSPARYLAVLPRRAVVRAQDWPMQAGIAV
jgi:hypothetical protein